MHYVARSVRVGSLLRLQNIRLSALNFWSSDEKTNPPYQIAVTITPRILIPDKFIVCSLNYKIVASKGPERIAQIDCRYDVAYAIELDNSTYQHQSQVVESEDFDAFARVVLPYTLHPYVRELVFDLSGKSGLPPLILEEMHLPQEVANLLYWRFDSGAGLQYEDIP
ncbi:protein-export chaperone SecB [Nonomuraea sp. NPDC049141]|uniref:protein-export chaperone SecB n=1 Tax=unclassified Nonomuraea TaxID=2593643 RepID=UPI0033C123E0